MIKKIKIGSFGRLSNVEIDLSPGINVIYGKNESGKSTVASFIRAMLYSMANRNRKIDGEFPMRKRFEPWSGGEMNGSLTVKGLEKTYIIERRFKKTLASDILSVKDAATLLETDELGDSPGETLYMMGDDTFKRTAFIGQSALETGKTGEMVDKLSNLASTMDEGISYENADKKLKSLRIKIKTGSNSIISNLLEKRKRLNEELLKARKNEEDLVDLYIQKKELLKKIERANKRLEHLRSQKELLLARAAGEDLYKIDTYKKELFELETEAAHLKATYAFASEEFLETLAEKTKELDSVEIIISAKREEIKNLEDSIVRREEEGASISLIKEGITLHEWLRENSHRLEKMKSDAQTAEKTQRNCDEINAQIDKIHNDFAPFFEAGDDKLSALTSKKPGLLMVLFSFFSFFAAGLFLLGIFTHKILFVPATLLLILAAVFLAVYIGAKRAYTPFASGGRRGFEHEYNKYLSAKEKASHLYQTLELLGKVQESGFDPHEITRLTAAINAACAELGEETVEGAIKRAYELYENSVELSADRRRLNQLKEDLAVQREQRDGILSEIEPLIKEAGNAADSVTPTELLKVASDGRSRLCALSPRINELTQRINGILQGREISEIKALYKRYDHTASIDFESVSQCDEAIFDLSEAVSKDKELLSNISGQIEGGRERTFGPEIIEEEIALIDEDIKKYEIKARGVDMAISVLKEAYDEMSASFAPKIIRLFNDYFDKISLGRHNSLKIDSDYDIKIVSPGDSIGRELDFYSRGTMDQAYISLRLALLKHLSKGAAVCPLIFDDSFSNFDDERLYNFMEILNMESRERQIIILSCQTRERDILKKLGKINEVTLA